MTRRHWLLVGLGIGFGLFIDLVVAYLLHRLTRSNLTDDSVAFWEWLCLIIVGQLVASIYMWLKRAALLAMYSDKGGSKRIAAQLDREGFPAPHLYDSATTYFETLIGDVATDQRIKIRAAFHKGELDGFNSAAGFLAGMRMLATWDTAIKILATDKNIRKSD